MKKKNNIIHAHPILYSPSISFLFNYLKSLLLLLVINGFFIFLIIQQFNIELCVNCYGVKWTSDQLPYIKNNNGTSFVT